MSATGVEFPAGRRRSTARAREHSKAPTTVGISAAQRRVWYRSEPPPRRPAAGLAWTLSQGVVAAILGLQTWLGRNHERAAPGVISGKLISSEYPADAAVHGRPPASG